MKYSIAKMNDSYPCTYLNKSQKEQKCYDTIYIKF